MNILINADEWMAPWHKQFAIDHLKQQSWVINWNETNKYVHSCKQEYKTSGLIMVDFNRVNYLLKQDLAEFRNEINSEYKKTFRENKSDTLAKIKQLGLSRQEIIDAYLNGATNGFAKSLAHQISSDNIKWILDSSDADWQHSFFIRNTINNEDLLKKCLDEQLEFWFVDTGYTNFLEDKNKKWHRLVKNHIHHSPQAKNFPTDRLSLFPKAPKGWRRKGSTILVIEGSPMHYRMRGTTLEEWREHITQEIRKYSDREIEFRPKNSDRKTRVSVYETLRETKDYYCVVSDSSAAAVEAIWTGTPVITLERHITNSVSRNKLADIDNLFRSDIEHWLTMLSYSQYTFDELCNGTAVGIVKEYFDA
jgi:hypothetical protein